MLSRDIRLKIFIDSIIVVMESNLDDRPDFFNCYLNFSMDVKNQYTSNAIKLYVKSANEVLDEKPFK